MKKRITYIITASCVVLSLFTGCGKANPEDYMYMGYTAEQIGVMYNELVEDYNNKDSELKAANEQIEQLKAENKLYEITTELADGSGELSINSVSGKIKIPNSLDYPGSYKAIPTGTLEIADKVKITPSSFWTVQVDGATVKLEQTDNGIAGNIQVFRVDKRITLTELINDIIDPAFSNKKVYKDIQYTDIYASTYIIGKQLEIKIKVDDVDSTLISGMMHYNKTVIKYYFVYKTESDSTKNELIKNLVETLTVDNSSILVQN